MMTRDEEVKRRPLFRTKDYEKFKFLPNDENRKKSDRHIKKIEKALSVKNFLHQSPIIVTEEFEILDGQHRFEAAKNIKTELYYEFGDEDMKAVIKANAGTLPWKIVDYLEHYAKQGIPEYLLLLEWKEKYPDFHFSFLFDVMNANGQDKVYMKFKDGEFKWGKNFDRFVTEAIFFDIKRTIDYIQSITINDMPLLRTNLFHGALYSFFNQPLVNCNEFMRLIPYNLHKLIPCASRKDYIEIFYYIYNFRKTTNKVEKKYVNGKSECLEDGK